MRTKHLLVAGTLVIIISCNSYKQKKLPSSTAKAEKAIGRVINGDSISKPLQINAGPFVQMAAGKPKKVITHNNIQIAGNPEKLPAGNPVVIIPGENGCPLPLKVIAVHNKIRAQIPEVVIAEEAGTKNRNPQNFSFFGKLQGLTGNASTGIFEDKRGNLWIGTMGSGVNMYDGRNFTHFTENEGLGQNYVKNILEDANDNIWFSTLSNGISKYDGSSFTNYTTKEGLSNNWVNSFAIDKNNSLWIATPGGLNVFDGKIFTRYGKDILGSDTVYSLKADKKGNMWIGTRGGIVKYDGKVFTRFIRDISRVIHAGSFSEDVKGNIWVGTGIGLFKFDGSSLLHFTKKQGLLSNFISCLEEDKDGNLWIGYEEGGITKYDGERMIHFKEEEGLNNYFVLDLFEDRRGNLWISTPGGGLNKYGGENFNHFTEYEGLISNAISGILEDDSGNIWISSTKGVSKYDGKNFTNFNEKEGLANRYVWSIMKDRKNNIWFGTFRAVSKYDGKYFTTIAEKEGLVNNDVKCMLEDRNGNLWFGAARGVTKYDGKTFTHYSDKNGLGDNTTFCFSMIEDRIGNIWFGTTGGLTKYDGKNFTNFTVKEKFGNNVVQSIIEDSRGFIWIGTETCGVIRYDGSTFRRFTQMDGLGSNKVFSVMEDRAGNFWCGTDNGISMLEKQQLLKLEARNEKENQPESSALLFKTYTYDDGFLGQGTNMGKTIYEAKDGTIWIGGGGLTKFHPKEMHADTIAPKIQLTGISLFNENIPWQSLLKENKEQIRDTAIVLTNGKRIYDIRFENLSRWYGIPEQLSLAHNNNFISFQFVGVTIQSPKKVKYQYKLEGFDNNWSTPSTRNDVTYGNLEHGMYTFKVKAMNGDGYWSDELSYTFTIRAPWWHTWWAYGLFTLLFLAMLYSVYSFRVNKINMKHEMVLQKHKTAELEMQALRSQMNPHFIFNSLNSIHLFILENNKLQACEYLVKFSRLVRLILHNSEETFIPLDNELEALKLYLELESLRFDEKFTFDIKVGDGVDPSVLKVPPLIIQPYAENAIWHGLMNKSERGHLQIEIYLHQQILYCKISDDGIGRKKAADLRSKSGSTGKSMGMRITADRIAILQDQLNGNSNVMVKDLILPDGSPGGTEVVLKIPAIT